jgi:hypothetical protein
LYIAGAFRIASYTSSGVSASLATSISAYSVKRTCREMTRRFILTRISIASLRISYGMFAAESSKNPSLFTFVPPPCFVILSDSEGSGLRYSSFVACPDALVGVRHWIFFGPRSAGKTRRRIGHREITNFVRHLGSFIDPASKLALQLRSGQAPSTPSALNL